VPALSDALVADRHADTNRATDRFTSNRLRVDHSSFHLVLNRRVASDNAASGVTVE